jgi:histidinol-phosphatase (PHP family)
MTDPQQQVPDSLAWRIDGHVHTRLCNHASGEMEEYVQAAQRAGITTLIFLEHLEASIHYDHRTWLTRNHFDSYFEEGKRLKTAFPGGPEILMGVEVGYNPSAVAELNQMLSEYPFAWRGLSYHFYFDGTKHHNMVSRRLENVNQLAALGVDRVLTDYFQGLLEAIDLLDCDILCHLDAVLRHYPHLRFTKTHHKLIERILNRMVEKEMFLEVNTSGFAIRDEQFPTSGILTAALERSIPLLPGSDAHRPQQVGRHFDRLAASGLPLASKEQLKARLDKRSFAQ